MNSDHGPFVVARPIFKKTHLVDSGGQYYDEMTIEDALDYIDSAVDEGYMDESVAQHLKHLPDEEVIRQCELMAHRGDAWANEGEDLPN